MADGKLYQTIARIGNRRCAGIADQGDRLSLLDVHDQLGRAGEFIMFVVADGARLDAVMVEQLGRLAGVFTGNEVDFLQNAYRTKGNVFQVSDGGADQIERGTVWRGPCCLWRRRVRGF